MVDSAGRPETQAGAIWCQFARLDFFLSKNEALGNKSDLIIPELTPVHVIRDSQWGTAGRGRYFDEPASETVERRMGTCGREG